MHLSVLLLRRFHLVLTPSSVKIIKLLSVYNGQMKRQVQKGVVSMFEHEFQSQVHEYQNTKMHFQAVTDVGPEPYSYMQQLVLEAWMTLMDPQSGNDHLHIPEVYESLAYARVLRYVF